MSTPLSVAIVGGHRGQTFSRLAPALEADMRLSAICDRDPERLAEWGGQHPAARRYDRYDDLLADPAVEAVVLATPFPDHAPQAIQALKSGKDVLCEVIAATTIDECWELIETVESTGRTYMFAENCCFLAPNRTVETMVERGLFGRLTYLEGAYIHDCRALLHTGAGELAWRGRLRSEVGGISYPTHALGPVAAWLRAGDPQDRFTSLSAFATDSVAIRAHFAAEFGAEHRGARPGFWQHGDSGTVMLRSASGVLAMIRVDSSSPRPSHPTTHFSLQGSNGAYLSPRTDHDDPLVWIGGHSPGASGDTAGRAVAEWEPLSAYAEFDDPLWRDRHHDVPATGHGGADYFTLVEFLAAVREGRAPAIDVYDAATWSSVFPLSCESLAQGGQGVPIPDFRRRAGKEKP